MTAQIRDRIKLEGRVMWVCSHIPVPLIRKRIRKNEDWDNTNYPFGSTACWRGYIASWRVEDNKLYLVDIFGSSELVGDEPLLADWFSGTIRLTEQRVNIYPHLGYVTRFDPDIMMKVEKGVVVRVLKEAETSSTPQG